MSQDEVVKQSRFLTEIKKAANPLERVYESREFEEERAENPRHYQIEIFQKVFFFNKG
jgi:hypothetical protein